MVEGRSPVVPLELIRLPIYRQASEWDRMRFARAWMTDSWPSLRRAVTSYLGLRLKAEAALETLITAPGVPANVRAAAVRTALELVGAIGAKAKAQEEQELSGDELDPETLTIEGIDREIHRLGRV